MPVSLRSRLPALSRQRVPLPAGVEALMRAGLALLRDDHGFRSRRGLLRYPIRAAVFLAMSPLRREVTATAGDLRYIVRTSDHTIGRSLWAGHDWEPLEVGAAFEALAAAGHRDFSRSTFVEVGANIGMTSIGAVAERGFARAIAFEPEPTLFDLLCRNIRLNDLEDRVRPIPLALSNRSGTLVLDTSGGNAGDNRIVDRSAQAGTVDSVQIRSTTFDREVERGTIRLDEVGLVWMDVQGHEADVLAGASTLLERGIPLVLEHSTDMLRAARRLEWLESFALEHYTEYVDLGWFALTRRLVFQPIADLPRLSGGGRRTDTNLLLVRRPATP